MTKVVETEVRHNLLIVEISNKFKILSLQNLRISDQEFFLGEYPKYGKNA